MQPTISVDQVLPQTYEQTRAILGVETIRRLTLWKWRYSLESAGFTPDQAHRVVFACWLYQHDRIGI